MIRVCHVTAHLPPDQAANALLPFHLGEWARARGDEVSYVAHPPRALGPTSAALPEQPGPVTWVAPRRGGTRLAGLGALSSFLYLLRLKSAAHESLERADVVHVHSNGLLAEGACVVAARLRKPVVLTLYGTEVWHYRPRRRGVDLFTRAFRSASHVTFYSRGLLDRAIELGLGREGLSVVYPPVAGYFRRRDERDLRDVRASLGLKERHVLVNVKRLHPLAGQRHLIDAMPAILRAHPDSRLVVCGTGPLRQALESQAADLGVSGHVTFTGLVDNRTVALYQEAADVFVLPSELEACPTVAIEALACGTPVISTDNPGGVELAGLFGADVTVVPRGNADALASATIAALSRGSRTGAATAAIIAREFAPPVVAERFHRIYEAAITAGIGRRTAAPGSVA